MTAGGTDSPTAGAALETLCTNYWYPLYAYVRRQGHGQHDAQDLTQAFFARLLEKNYLADVQREKGRFRSFLLASLKHFLANEWALTLLDKVLNTLRAEYEQGGKAEAFEILKPYLSAGRASVSYAHAAEKLGMNEGAVKVAVHRLRKRYRELLRAEIAQTVSTASEIEAEIRYLFSALSA